MRHGPDWRTTLSALVRRLDHPIRGVVSRDALARDLGVDGRTVRRWLACEDLPAPHHAAAVRAWLARHRTDRREPRSLRTAGRTRVEPRMPM